MKTLKKMNIALSVLALLFISSTASFAQQFKLNNQSSTLVVKGTSSLHDWEETAENQKGSLDITTTGGLTINNLKIEIEAESLKSGKSAMDKNSYKALKTNKYKYITFELLNTKSVQDLGNGTYKVAAEGNLTISGTTKKVGLDFELALKGNQATLKGSKNIKMTDFNVEPPTALFGTVTTGDALTIEFNTIMIN
ncbi:YceI family protein [Mangrovimonas sp. YM274]|uniref:YceI family protein n=1 Tax=Mangrovimonas sp. YM274 TaxID=3070660 RepID=UPI0027DDF6AD|nr:YceI family protein [Mangrovimonas sp. YM274]WMI68084.1 YceI family protein [Mangrovimonas sp. YM274]